MNIAIGLLLIAAAGWATWKAGLLAMKGCLFLFLGIGAVSALVLALL